MPYHQFTITVPDKYADRLAQALMSIGTLGTIDRDGMCVAYFPAALDPDVITGQLDVFGALITAIDGRASYAYTHTFLADADWNESWKKGFIPLDLGERFTVLPPWETHRSGRIPLVIDPGMAFGTGHHETTRSCLALMERHASLARDGRFLDLGTGTGLLAIAAWKLGFRDVLGIDTDPLAIEAALRNCELNGTIGIRLAEGTIAVASGSFAVIAANLIATTLIELAEDISARLKPGGAAILSGILAGQDAEVEQAFAMAGLRCERKLRDGKWMTLDCTR